MQFDQIPSASGHVFRREGKRGPVWYAKYRLPDGASARGASDPPGPGEAGRPPATSRSARRRSGCAGRLTMPASAPCRALGYTR